MAPPQLDSPRPLLRLCLGGLGQAAPEADSEWNILEVRRAVAGACPFLGAVWAGAPCRVDRVGRGPSALARHGRVGTPPSAPQPARGGGRAWGRCQRGWTGGRGPAAPRPPAETGPPLVLGPERQAPQTQTHDGVCHESFRGRSGLRSRRVPLASLGMEVAPAPRCLLPAWVEAALVSETGAARLRFPALNISWSRPRTCNRRGLREQASAQTPRASGPCRPAPRPIPARPFHLRLSFFVHAVGGRVGGRGFWGTNSFYTLKVSLHKGFNIQRETAWSCRVARGLHGGVRPSGRGARDLPRPQASLPIPALGHCTQLKGRAPRCPPTKWGPSFKRHVGAGRGF